MVTREVHDQFAKHFLEELLTLLGKVNINREVSDEPRQIDVFFSPNPESIENPPDLGILSRIISTPVLFEVFRNPPNQNSIRECVLKLFVLIAEIRRQAKRERRKLKEEELPYLWILGTSVSKPILEGFDAKLEEKNPVEGVYVLSKFLRTGMISVSRLPINQETLYLRILGRGETQSGAVQELLNLPQANPMRQKIAELLVSWRISIEIQEQLKKEDQEVFMALSQVYLEWKEATKQEGRLEGLQEGRQEEAANLVLRQLTRKLANLSETMVKRVKKLTIPQLENLGEALLEFTQIGDLETFLSKLESKPEQSTLTQLDAEQPDRED
ncbi:DUF4351 domain-containing protein [Cylindrospermopsis raciborskii]|uniref:DUF4351 domain-containing protein n=1 Tax=Cylindrospermopsis raciborskii TaxID=77022 RepID=UPI0008DC991E|nr:DUF4351 domain-containing protein [Cylindrospermopsis raciborskii]NLQ05568.1 DUF4351 domain-containing protein [Cylindrospermopsis raciborskii MVCC19]OHY34799.1 hypothetical protein BCV64_04955 [Cylindrospermopsis raciborskii MVCC14]